MSLSVCQARPRSCSFAGHGSRPFRRRRPAVLHLHPRRDGPQHAEGVGHFVHCEHVFSGRRRPPAPPAEFSLGTGGGLLVLVPVPVLVLVCMLVSVRFAQPPQLLQLGWALARLWVVVAGRHVGAAVPELWRAVSRPRPILARHGRGGRPPRVALVAHVGAHGVHDVLEQVAHGRHLVFEVVQAAASSAWLLDSLAGLLLHRVLVGGLGGRLLQHTLCASGPAPFARWGFCADTPDLCAAARVLDMSASHIKRAKGSGHKGGTYTCTWTVSSSAIPTNWLKCQTVRSTAILTAHAGDDWPSGHGANVLVPLALVLALTPVPIRGPARLAARRHLSPGRVPLVRAVVVHPCRVYVYRTSTTTAKPTLSPCVCPASSKVGPNNP